MLFICKYKNFRCTLCVCAQSAACSAGSAHFNVYKWVVSKPARLPTLMEMIPKELLIPKELMKHQNIWSALTPNPSNWTQGRICPENLFISLLIPQLVIFSRLNYKKSFILNPNFPNEVFYNILCHCETVLHSNGNRKEEINRRPFAEIRARSRDLQWSFSSNAPFSGSVLADHSPDKATETVQRSSVKVAVPRQ